jgi:hypothetical protein
MTKQTVLGNSRSAFEQDYTVQHASLQTLDKECRKESNIKFITPLSLNYSGGKYQQAQPTESMVTIDSVDLAYDGPIEIGLDILRCK